MSNNGINAGIIRQLLGNMNVPPNVSDGERALLRRLIAEEDAETGEQLTRFVPGGWWIEFEQLPGPLCFRLIRHSFVSLDGEWSETAQLWRVNEMGRMAAEGKSLAEITEAVR